MIPSKSFWRKDFPFVFILIFFIAAALRWLFLEWKPIHFDEGVNGWFVEQIKQYGTFDYNPENFHGPLYFYILWLFDSVFGSSIAVHRFVAATFSLATLAIFYKSSKLFLPKNNLGIVAIALSPAMVFYARYSIHESLLLFGLALFIHGWLILFKSQSKKLSLWILTIGLAIMATTKETFLIFFFNAFIALAIVVIWRKYKSLPFIKFKDLDLSGPVLFLVVTILVFYSEFFTNIGAVKEFFSAFAIWKKTGFSSGHDKEFYYWLSLMCRYEWLFLAGFALSIYYWFSKDPALQFLAIYAFGNFLAFSLIPYKTPWLIIAILYPFAFFLNNESVFLQKKQVRVLLSFVGLAMGIKALQLNFINYADPTEPYVYVQTSTEMTKAMAPLKKFAKNYENEKLLVSLDSQWPLPWILKDYKAAAYVASPPTDWNDFSIMILDRSDFESLSITSDVYFILNFQIRYEQEESVLVIDKSLSDLVDAYR